MRKHSFGITVGLQKSPFCPWPARSLLSKFKMIRFESYGTPIVGTMLSEIASFEIINDDEAIDEIYWNGSPSGGFSLGSAMRQCESPSLEQIKGWKQIWSVAIPQRIRMFLWLAVQDRLMTNINRYSQNY